MNKMLIAAALALALGITAGCFEEEQKKQADSAVLTRIEEVKNTVIPDCGGKTMRDLVDDLFENPVWGYENIVTDSWTPGQAPPEKALSGQDESRNAQSRRGKEFVTVSGTLGGDTLPDFIRKQKILDTTFRFALDPATGRFNPDDLGGFPTLTSPEGIFQAYKLLTCSGAASPKKPEAPKPEAPAKPGDKNGPVVTTLRN